MQDSSRACESRALDLLLSFPSSHVAAAAATAAANPVGGVVGGAGVGVASLLRLPCCIVQSFESIMGGRCEWVS